MFKRKAVRWKKIGGAVNRKSISGKALLACFLLLAGPLPILWAGDAQNISYMERGIYRILTAAFQLPRYLIQKTFTGPPILGTVDGALTGTFYTISSVMGGAFDIARGVVPYAKYMVFFI